MLQVATPHAFDLGSKKRKKKEKKIVDGYQKIVG